MTGVPGMWICYSSDTHWKSREPDQGFPSKLSWKVNKGEWVTREMRMLEFGLIFKRPFSRIRSFPTRITLQSLIDNSLLSFSFISFIYHLSKQQGLLANHHPSCFQIKTSFEVRFMQRNFPLQKTIGTDSSGLYFSSKVNCSWYWTRNQCWIED